MAKDQNRVGPTGRLSWLKRARLVTVLTTLFLVAVYGAGIYALTRTGTAGASRGPVGKPCTADNGHPFQHGHAPVCTTTTTSSSSTSIGSSSIIETSSIIQTSAIGTTSIIETSSIIQSSAPPTG